MNGLFARTRRPGGPPGGGWRGKARRLCLAYWCNRARKSRTYNGAMSPRKPLRIAVTADLHFGSRHPSGNRATLNLAARLAEDPPDLLLLAGDIGAGDDFDRCLSLFAKLPSRKAAVPGNHDIWVRTDDPRGDSLDVYDRHLPAVCQSHGFNYLDRGPLVLPESDLAVVGTMNWYDYTWDNDLLRKAAPNDWADRLRTKRFTRGM